MTPATTFTLRPPAAPAPTPRTWLDCSERFWSGMGAGRFEARERFYGPVTLIVFRDATGWACRCGLWPTRRLRAMTFGEASGEAVAMLRAAVAEVAKAI